MEIAITDLADYNEGKLRYDWLDVEGLSDLAMVKPMMDGIEAKKPLIATWEGKITDQLWVADHPTRAKFLEQYHRLKGNFIDKHELTGRDGGDIILQVKIPKGKGRRQTIEVGEDD